MKKLLILIAILLNFTLIAQIQPNNSCGSATTLSVNSSCINNTFTMPNAGFTNDGYTLAGCNIGNNRDDGWYKFQAISIVTEITIDAVQDIIIHVYSGTCGTFTLIGCADNEVGDPEILNIPTTIGTWYYVRIQRYNSSSGITGGVICLYNTNNCNWSLCLEDSYGDGWNDAYLEVFVNSVSIGYAEILDGFGPDCYYLPAGMSDNVSIIFYSGTWDEECSYYLYDDLGGLNHSETIMPANYNYTQTCNGSLPLELIEFNTNCNENSRIIEWSTASESNTDYFILRSSEDGTMFSAPLSTIPAAGNSSILRNYSFIDNSIYYDHTVYYELTEYDISGYTKVLGIRSSTCDFTSDIIEIYPNPVNEGEPLFIISDDEIKSIQVTDLLGRDAVCTFENGNVKGLSSGVYLMIVDGVKKFKIIVK